MRSTSKKIFNGVIWTTLQTLINRAFGFIIKLILARLLFPEDFGLIGMAVVFTSFMEVFNDLGFGAALIQRKKEIISKEYYSTAFWSGIIWSIIIYLLIVLLIAPLAANVYDEPILTVLIPVLSIGVLASPINLVHKAQLTKNFSFKELAVISNSSSLFSGLIAIALALCGAGVWSLAFNSVAFFIVAMPLYFKFNKWRPTLEWSKACFQDLFGFGIYTTLSNLIRKVATHGDYFIIGIALGKVELGLYSFAFILTDSIRAQIKTILNSVLFPVYSELQDNHQRQIHYYSKNVFYNSLIITPIMAFFIYTPEVITLMFGEKWEASKIIVQIISISVLVESITVSFPSLLRANNKTNLEFKIQIFHILIFYLPLLFIGIFYYGIVGGAIAVLVGRIIGIIINLITLEKILLFPFRRIIKSFLSGVIPSVISLFLSLSIVYLINLMKVGEYFISLFKMISFPLFVLGVSYYMYKNEIQIFRQFLKK